MPHRVNRDQVSARYMQLSARLSGGKIPTLSSGQAPRIWPSLSPGEKTEQAEQKHSVNPG